MIYSLLLVPLNVLAISYYMVVRNRSDFKRIAVIQPLTTILSIAIVVLSLWAPGVNRGFTFFIMSGLSLSLIADFINVDMSSPRVLIAGLIIFMFAYLVYALGLTLYNGFQPQDWAVGAILLILYVIEMWYLWPGLGDMKVPVLIYALVLPFLLSRAVSTFFGDTFSITQAGLLTAGAAMLYLGDLEYGIHRFRKPLPVTFGPILYAGGQLLIALSPAFFSG